MYREYTRMVEETVKEYSCDIGDCDFVTISNRGCCGHAPIMTCDFCGEHACGKHREVFYENEWSDDYPKFTACNDCAPKATRAFEIANHIAGRHDDIFEKTKEVFENMSEFEEQHILDGIVPDLEMLWENDRYDCPLCGIAMFNGEYCWFEIVDWEEDETQYHLRKLTPGDIQVELERHAKFQALVGYHTDHVPSVYRDYEAPDTVDQFYQDQKSWEPRDYSDNEILGTFKWSDFKYYARPSSPTSAK